MKIKYCMSMIFALTFTSALHASALVNTMQQEVTSLKSAETKLDVLVHTTSSSTLPVTTSTSAATPPVATPTTTAVNTSAMNNARNRAIADEWASDDASAKAAAAKPVQASSATTTPNTAANTTAMNNAHNRSIADEWASDNASAKASATSAATTATTATAATAVQVSTKFYNVSSTTMIVQALLDGVASGAPVTITYKADPIYYNFGTVTTNVAANQKLTYNISVNGRTTSAVADYDPVKYPAGYQINASATTVFATGLAKPYNWETQKSSVSTKFYNVSSTTMTVQALLDGVASGTPVTITYKADPTYYNFGTVTTDVTANQKLTYNISVNGRTNSAVVPYDPVKYPAGYQINASATTVVANGLAKPYDWETKKSSVSTKFYNVSSTTMTVQALIDKVPSGAPVTITYKADPIYYNSGVVTTEITPNQKLSYIIAVNGRANSATADYDPVKCPAGYRINASATTVIATGLAKPYDWETKK